MLNDVNVRFKVRAFTSLTVAADFSALTSAGATISPRARTLREATRANGDYLGAYEFWGGTSASITTSLYGRIVGRADTTTAASEDGAIEFRATVGGAEVTVAALSKTGIKVNRSLFPTADPHVDGAVWLNSGAMTVSSG